MKNIIFNNYQILVSVIIFIFILAINIPFYKAVTLLLELIVVMEVVKMVTDFIEKRKLRLRYVIDIFIIFLIRDAVILITQPVKQEREILFLLFVIFVFFIFRILALMYSPSLFLSRKTKIPE
ncbi:MAG: hypothetical protein QG567_2163 [Campylobacterota bacterium]|nr:hypothetical protein [Campylobacterota bacterium]